MDHAKDVKAGISPICGNAYNLDSTSDLTRNMYDGSPDPCRTSANIAALQKGNPTSILYFCTDPRNHEATYLEDLFFFDIIRRFSNPSDTKL